MPQVPTYDGPQVRSTALQPVQQQQVDVSSGLMAAGRAVGQVGQELEGVMRREAETEVNRIDNEVTAGWLEWDAKARRQYQGQNAGEYEVAAKDWWDKAAQNYAANVSPLVRQTVGPALGRKRNQALGSVLGYVNAEKERFADDQADKAALTTIEFGVDTGDTVGAAERVRKIVAEKGARKGWTTEMVQADQQRLLGTMHLTVIQSMAETDAAGAAKYYAANKGEIPAAAQPQVDKLLKAEGDNQFAMTFAAKVAAKPLAEQITAAADIADPERKKKALAQITQNHTLIKAAQAEKEAAASDEAWQLVGQGKRVPEAVLMRMDGKSRVQLQEHLVDRAKVIAAGTPVKTDWEAYIDLREKLAAGEKVDLRPYAGTKIAPAQLEQLLDIQTKVKDAKKAPEVATSEQQVNAAVQSLNFKGERAGQYHAAAQDMFNEFLKANKREPTYDERRDILDSLTKDIVLKKREWWPDATGPAYTAPRDVRNAALAPSKFTVGQVYTDAKGNRARYTADGKWEPIK